MSPTDDRTGLYQDLEETSSSSPYSRGHALNTGILNSEERIKKRQHMKSNVKLLGLSRTFKNLSYSVGAHHGSLYMVPLPNPLAQYTCHQGRHVRNRSHCVFARAANALDLAATRWVNWRGCTSFIG